MTKKVTVGQIVERVKSLQIGRTIDSRVQNTLVIALMESRAKFNLDFEKLLAADNFNFVHDIDGILEKWNSKTQSFDDFFWPRCGCVKTVAGATKRKET